VLFKLVEMSFFEQNVISKIENVYNDKQRHISIDIKREDKIHPKISGNKFRKLKYNIKQAIKEDYKCILTYGGAFSNHIAATAAATNLKDIRSIGIIRGEEIESKLAQSPDHNPTLAFAKSQGMEFHFISREDYKNKDEISEIEKLKQKYGEFYRIPEGGTNELAVKGCEEILNENDKAYDVITCCVGTGGTLAGIINSSKPHQEVIGFSSLKGHNHNEINQFIKQDNFKIIEDIEFGGYAKSNRKLIEFINSFYRCTSIKLDPIYTGKMMFKLFEMINNNSIANNTKILAIHSGGLQGIQAFNYLQKSKNRTALIFQ
jgi:1-aminocyclopropane-1-carboxylate deaminase